MPNFKLLFVFLSCAWELSLGNTIPTPEVHCHRPKLSAGLTIIGPVEAGDEWWWINGRQLYYQCANGFTTDDSVLIGSVSCNDNNDRTTFSGFCSSNTCGELPIVMNGHFSQGESFVGSTRRLLCNRGFVIDGLELITCSEDRKWMMDGHCVSAVCNDLPDLENGHVTNGSSYIGGTRNAYCHSGFGLTGSRTVTCGPDRKWHMATGCKKVRNIVEFVQLAAKGDMARLEHFIDKDDADVNSRDPFGTSALMMAAGSGQSDVVRLLIDRGADVNYAREVDGDNALIKAAWNGHLDVIRLLLHYGADVNARDINGNTALSMAHSRGHPNAAHELTLHGARP